MLNQDDFLKEVHNFQTDDPEFALQEAKRYNEIGVEGGQLVEAVEMPGLGWCLMLAEAAEIARLAIAPDSKSDPLQRLRDEGATDEIVKAIIDMMSE